MLNEFDSKVRPVAYVLAAHNPLIDPRIGWFASSLLRSHDVYVIGACDSDVIGDSPTYERGDDGITTVKVARTKHNAAWLPSLTQMRSGPSAPRGLLGVLAGFAVVADRILDDRIDAYGATADEVARFRSLCGYFVNTNSTLIEAMQNMGAPDLIVAADLDTLPAATAIAGDVGCFCAYDAHEYWPYAFPEFRKWEIRFWLEVERQLSRLANLRVAVSQPLAMIMSDEYGCEFLTLPNCATLAEGEVIDLETALAQRGASGPMKVIFLGNFAEGRGLEETIRTFAHVKSDARLILQGRDNSYKGKLIELARSLGLGEERVSFPPAVPESALVETAAKADIGLIPYNPAYFGYRYCCPNKLSQYMAGGLPILSSSTEYVAGIVKRENIGEVVDIDDPLAFAATIDRLNERRHELLEVGRRARQYFQEYYHWEAVVSSVMQRIEAGCMLNKRHYTRVDLDWIASASARRAGHGTVGSLDPTLFGVELVASIRTGESRGSAMLRGLWHLVPTQVRYTFVEWLRRRIS